MKNKKLFLALTALVVVAAVMIGIYVLTRPETEEGTKTITVKVVHGDGSEKTFTCSTEHDVLGEVLIEEGLVEGELGEFGLFISAVDGEMADYNADGAWWGVYHNGELAVLGADTLPISDGDAFSLVYTIGWAEP